ncbi:MAG: 23S rRNA (adenine1618-N6)-methyltransferase [Flammeovirgaceae bacterium]|jgi:23S rRNA (adenine1618-N6)-methyltransferase
MPAPTPKNQLHPRNKHQGRYDLEKLISVSPKLKQFVFVNKYGNESIDFASPEAVQALNQALLKLHYGVGFWEVPENYLCPPIPGRVDYIHYIADLLAEANSNQIPTGMKVRCLDIGVGASAIYPILGNSEYGWSFLGTDVDEISLEAAKKNMSNNPSLKGDFDFRLQPNLKKIFAGVIGKEKKFDLTICNPPFHASLEDAEAGNLRKLSNLARRKVTKTKQNFGGQKAELWCEGGEKRFIQSMIRESKQFGKSCLWFTTLVSKKDNLTTVYFELDKANVADIRTIEMGQGNKISRIVAWTFQNEIQRKEWAEKDWR